MFRDKTVISTLKRAADAKYIFVVTKRIQILQIKKKFLFFHSTNDWFRKYTDKVYINAENSILHAENNDVESTNNVVSTSNIKKVTLL